MTIEWKTSYKIVNYPDALAFMENKIEQIYHNKAQEMIWLLEHPSIYTAGSSASDNELINAKDLPVYLTGRGGKYTYHGPGQRVIYLMLNLKNRGSDIRKYVANLENWIIASLKEIGIIANRKEGKIGIWTKNNLGNDVKIAAIGIRVRKWVAYHGISINVSPNLDYYNGIIACGIKEFGVASLKELGYDISYLKLDNILKSKFNDFF
jgi:lipoyl(octanoyl) transferase